MPREIHIATGARLHFGLLAHGTRTGREFGGVGVMIDRPGFRIRASRAPVDELACGDWSSSVEMYLARLRAAAPAVVPPGLRIEIHEAPPAHAGFGSGTQLGMALARICSTMAGESDVSAEELARRAGRGRRSAVGLYGFALGGLVIEAGKFTEKEISPLVARVEFPAEWRFVLVRPRGAAGISGTDESSGFARLGPMPDSVTGSLCRIAMTEIIPSTRDRDFLKASAAIGRFGRLVGEYFAPVQGGIFADDKMQQLAERLSARNISGFGQTSWGPTVFTLCANDSQAAELVAELSQVPSCRDCELTVASPLNRGARVEAR